MRDDCAALTRRLYYHLALRNARIGATAERSRDGSVKWVVREDIEAEHQFVDAAA